jgi:hypothetical protein
MPARVVIGVDHAGLARRDPVLGDEQFDLGAGLGRIPRPEAA